MKFLTHSQTSGWNRWNVGIDKKFPSALYGRCNYLSMLWLKLIYVSKMSPWLTSNFILWRVPYSCSLYNATASTCIDPWVITSHFYVDVITYPYPNPDTDAAILSVITMTSLWARYRLKSPASRLYTQPFIQTQIEENIKAPRHWPLCGYFTGDRSITRTNGQ